jgi:hypothetical protein
MRLIGTYTFTVFGDGKQDEVAIRLDAIKTPEPLTQGRMPTGIAEARIGQGPGNVTGTLEGTVLHLKFDVPPSSAKVTVDALFGTDY